MIRRVLVLVLAAVTCATQALAEVTVQVRGEAPLTAEIAAWRPAEQLLVVFADGSDRLIPAYKVVKIADAAGADRTRFVFYGRGFVGNYPETYQGSRKAGSVNFKPLVYIVGVSAGLMVVFLGFFLLGGGSETNPKTLDGF